MAHGITFDVILAKDLSNSQSAEVIELCSAAYEENFEHYLEQLRSPVHVLAHFSGNLVSHAAWITRWLQVNEGNLLRTAYVEAVATAPPYQGRGFASALLRELFTHIEIERYDLGALSPSDAAFYARLGWELWNGPLAIRTKEGLLPTPDEQVMIYRFAHTPNLNLNGCLTAEWREGELW